MDRRYFFERNLLSLSAHNPALCSRLSGAETTRGHYRFLESRCGQVVPAFVDASGAAHPLHSMVDPRREAERLISTLQDEGFVVLLGLGAGFTAEAALARADVSCVLAIDFDIDSIAELFCSREYINILGDSRFSLLVDPPPGMVETFILEQYHPALAGGLRSFPLRSRVNFDIPRFSAAADAIQKTIEKISTDYSVQAHFGGRWFSNIIRNLKTAEAQNRSIPPIKSAAICAAGPSLDAQIPQLFRQREKEQGLFVISSDTALSALLKSGITPDAAVSIDCQHISYYHFPGAIAKDIPLFLDIASPPLLSRFSDRPFFFSGGHPLARYVSHTWRPLPLVDTSGGNVTYACLSLAQALGALRITVYGADFSYPHDRVYARGTYLFPFFEKKQTRLAPLEGLFSNFLYRSPFLPPEDEQSGVMRNGARRETAALRFYRKRFEEKASSINAQVFLAPGMGAQVNIRRASDNNAGQRVMRLFAPGRALMDAEKFLEQYRAAILALPLPGTDSGMYMRRLKPEEREILTTLLPLAAAVKRRETNLTTAELIGETTRRAAAQISRVLSKG